MRPPGWPGPVLDLLVTSCTVVTSHEDGEPRGCLVASVMPVGVGTRTVALALTTGSRTHRAVARSGVLALHVLAEADVATARAFAGPGDRFAGVAWSPGVLGTPVLDRALGVLEVKVVSSQELSGCTVLGAEVEASYRPSDPSRAPMTIITARENGLEATRSHPAGHTLRAD